MKKSYIFYLAFLILGISIIACGGNEGDKENDTEETEQITEEDKELLSTAQKMFKVLPTVADNEENPITNEKVKLGQYLYFDTNLSAKGNNSCNSCHNLNTFGVDNKPTSTGDDGKNGDRNSPTVLNAAFHSAQFWDGRAKDVEEQAGGPILNPVEMHIVSESFVVARLSKIPIYKEMFAKAFPNNPKITFENITKAIAAFERKLTTPGKFDVYLEGDITALSKEEREGMQLFLDTGCNTCHNGANLGGNMFQKFGIYEDYWKLTKCETVDEGKFGVTNSEADKYMFKVPGLRNVAETGPYFHDGSVEKLEDAISIMAKAQLNKDLKDDEVAKIKTFLEALTGEVPADLKTAPKDLPKFVQ